MAIRHSVVVQRRFPLTLTLSLRALRERGQPPLGTVFATLAWQNLQVGPRASGRFSLSQRERAGVRGKKTVAHPTVP